MCGRRKPAFSLYRRDVLAVRREAAGCHLARRRGGVDRKPNELKNTTYELFIAGLSILSIVNLVLIYLIPNPVAAETALIVDGFISTIFLLDFLGRLATADSKANYVVRQYGWADLLACLPYPPCKALRLFRTYRSVRLARNFGKQGMITEMLSNRALAALLALLFLVLLVLEFGAMAMVAVEAQSPDSNIKTASDAIWYTYVTITTIGYGDRYPVTESGRLIGMVIMTAGVGLFGTLSAFLAKTFLAPFKRVAQKKAKTSDDPLVLLADLRAMSAAQHEEMEARMDALERQLKQTKRQ
jgi:hypothetical protein